MTCDEVLPACEFGDAARRQAAHRHALDCPTCPAVLHRWQALKADLAATPPLTDRDRALWRDARQGAPGRRRVPRGWLAGAAAVAVCGAVALVWPRPEPAPPPAAPAEVLAAVPDRAAQDYEDFGRRLDELDGELAALTDRIATAEARRTAAELTAQYRH